MKTLLHKHFLREGEHHVAKAKHHRAIAAAAEKVRGMQKGTKSDVQGVDDVEGLDEFLESYIEQHSAIADEHADFAAHCTKCAKVFTASGKAAGFGGDLDELEPMPPGLSRVTPDHPSFRAVPRAGQREIAKADVPSEFAKLVQVDDEGDQT